MKSLYLWIWNFLGVGETKWKNPGNSRGWGGITWSPPERKFRGGGGSNWKKPSVGGYGYFLEPHNMTSESQATLSWKPSTTAHMNFRLFSRSSTYLSRWRQMVDLSTTLFDVVRITGSLINMFVMGSTNSSGGCWNESNIVLTISSNNTNYLLTKNNKGLYGKISNFDLAGLRFPRLIFSRFLYGFLALVLRPGL